MICISNKIFNPEFSAKNSEIFEEKDGNNYNFSNNFNTNKEKIDKNADKNVEISKLLSVDIEDMQIYLENFILNYLNNLYFDAKNFNENEGMAKDLQIFEEISNDENVEIFLLKIKPVFLRIFNFYTDSNECMYFEEFNK